jgi:hypothetical protein
MVEVNLGGERWSFRQLVKLQYFIVIKICYENGKNTKNKSEKLISAVAIMRNLVQSIFYTINHTAHFLYQILFSYYSS